MNQEREGLNVPESTLTEFFDDLEGRLSLLSGIVPMENVGLTLEEVRRPIIVVGLPGIGKTSGIISIRKKLNNLLPEDKQLGFKKILLGQTVVGSMSGIPIHTKDGGVIRVQMPDLPNPERDGEYGILFLDELTTADEAQVQPALGLCDDSRNIGEYTLPEHWLVVAAGNGPESTNFLRLDDMTLSRFVCYDIAYNYKQDWRPWAYEHNIHPDIIAFLNFSPETCVQVHSTDADRAGKMFPCPRTWDRLSTELKMRESLGKPVQYSELDNFAGRIIGSKAGREFSAFCAYHKKVDYSAEKIAAGTERDPEQMDKQIYHIILQSCIKYITEEIKKKKDEIETKNFSVESATMVSNFLKWLIKFENIEFENCIQSMYEIAFQAAIIKDIIMDPDFYSVCPELEQFFKRNRDYIVDHSDDLMRAANH